MDLHRCRFVPYQPSAINALAFSHPKTRSSKKASFARLAIGRANGDIEIWNPSNGVWHQEIVIRGGKDRSIDGLVWVNEPDQDLGDGRVLVGKSRLFSIGYTSAMTEWDLEKGRPKRHASGQHGDIWCIAAQPLSDGGASGEQQRLIAGTIDGELVMYSLEDDDLRFQRVIVRSPTKKAQIVSIAFQSRKVVIVGCSDSTLRAYDIAKGHLLRRMTLGSDLVGGSKEIIVWSVQCLPNGNIVSGDSTGQLTIWDGKTYTQMQRIQSHKQDILSTAVSADGSTILSGGMDRRTVLYKQNGSRWGKVWGRRYHDHDVKSMASFESGHISVVVSGGPDSNPVVVPLKEIGRENHRMISGLPQQPPITSAPKSRFIISWWEREVHLWVLSKSAKEINEDEDINQNRKLLKTIVIKGDFNISSATVNSDGTLLVVSTATDIKAFRLEHDAPTKPSDVKVTAVELPPRVAQLGASQLQLSPDATWLCIIQQGLKVTTTKLELSESTISVSQISTLPRINRHVSRFVQAGGLGSYDRNITQISFSHDSKMLAVADLAGYVDTWILSSEADKPQEESESDDSESDEESVVSGLERWVRNPAGKLIPKLPSTPTVLSFSDDVLSKGGDYTLLAITNNFTLLAFHPLEGTLTPWSRRNPRRNFPHQILDLLDLPKGVIWQGQRVWVYGVTFLVMIDLSLDLPKLPDGEVVLASAGSKRKRTGAGGKMLIGNMAPHKVHHHVNGAEEGEEDIDMADDNNNNNTTPGYDSEDEDMEGGELANLRNNTGTQSGEVEVRGEQKKSWWMTYKYRPIFGVVSLGEGELALMERPTWDVESQDRYFGGDEWER